MAIVGIRRLTQRKSEQVKGPQVGAKSATSKTTKATKAVKAPAKTATKTTAPKASKATSPKATAPKAPKGPTAKAPAKKAPAKTATKATSKTTKATKAVKAPAKTATKATSKTTKATKAVKAPAKTATKAKATAPKAGAVKALKAASASKGPTTQAPAKRGRPRKVDPGQQATPPAGVGQLDPDLMQSTRKRGRPRKVDPGQQVTSSTGTVEIVAGSPEAPRKRGRPRKVVAEGAEISASVAKKSGKAPKKVEPEPEPEVIIVEFDPEFLKGQRVLLETERETYLAQAALLREEADAIARELEPSDLQFDEESGEGGSVPVDREVDLMLSAQALAEVEEIDVALAKLDRGTYGVCESCRHKIPEVRLEVIPHARLCVQCKSGSILNRR